MTHRRQLQLAFVIVVGVSAVSGGCLTLDPDVSFTMTEFGHEELSYDDYMITVYTPNYFEKHDVDPFEIISETNTA